MKVHFLKLIVLLMAGSAMGEDLQTVTVGLSKALIPVGFDDNDRVQLVVQGTFQDTCHRLAGYKVEVENGTIFVEQKAYRYSFQCLQMLVPFAQVIDVGIIKEKVYQVADRTSANLLGTLAVTHSNNPGPDDHLYLPVNDAFISEQGTSGKRSVVIRGTFLDDCTTLQEIRVHVYSNAIVVLPVALRRTFDVCEPKRIPFSYEQNIDQTLHGEYLLHVRSLNGQAVNKIEFLR